MEQKNSFGVWAVIIIVVLILVGIWKFGTSSNIASNVATNSTSTTADNQGTSATDMNPTPGAALDGNTFRLSSYDAHVIPAEENYLITFQKGVVQGKICNSFSGPYTTANGTISAKLVSTLMACIGSGDASAAEEIFTTVLAQSAKYTFDHTTLLIIGTGHTLSLNAFVK